MKLLKTSPEEAERLKIEHGSAVAALAPPDDQVGVLQLGQIHERPMQRRVLCEIIESRMRELATFVRQQLEKSGHFGLLPGGIVLTGGGSSLKNVSELFADQFGGQKIRIGTPKVKGSNASKVQHPSWAAAIGAAKFAFCTETDELAPVGDEGSLGGRIKTIWSMLSGKV
jgi:cell division protein FtsA